MQWVFLQAGFQTTKPFYIAPYLSGGVNQESRLNGTETGYAMHNDPKIAVGLDVKYGITSNLTADLTVNTDFAQVESDNAQINLTRFSLFFPEKRMFFQEQASNFAFAFDDMNTLFYSRQIGLHEGRAVPINGLVTNIRLRYNPREGNDFYLVLNEGRNIELNRESPKLDPIANRGILVKYTYTFVL